MKINSDKDLDELFQNKLAEEKMSPSGKLWNNIEAELDKYKRKPGYYWWFRIGAASLLLLTGSYFLLRDNSEKISDQKNISAIDKTIDNKQSTIDKEKNKDEINNKTKAPDNSSQRINSSIEKSKTDQTEKINADPKIKDAENKNKTSKNNPINDSTKHETFSSSHPQKMKNTDVVNPNLNTKQNDPKSSAHDEKPKLTVDKNQEKKVDNKQSATDNDKKNNPPSDEDLKNKISGQTEMNVHSHAQVNNSDPHSDKKPDTAPSLLDTMNKKQNENPIVVSNTKKENAPDSSTTPSKKIDSTKNIPHNTLPIVRPDSSPIPKEKTKRFYLAGFYALNVQSSGATNNNWNVSGHDPAVTCFTKNNSPARGNYSIGGKFGYFVSKRIAIDAEVNYSYLENTSDEFLMSYWKYANPVPDFTVFTSFGNVKISGSSFKADDNSRPWNYFGDSCWIRGKVKEKYQFINIPISARFNLIDKNFYKIYLRAGGVVNYIFSEDMDFTVTKSENEIDFKEVEGLNKMNIGFVFGLGTEFKIYRGLGIWAEPGWRYTATSLNKSIKNHPGSIVIPFGFIYHF